MFSLAFSNLATNDFTTVVPSLFFEDGKLYFVQGLHKLLSQAVFLLLTEKGSIAGSPSLGLDLVNKLAQINLSEIARVEQVVSDINRDLSDQLRLLTRGLPDDERYGSVTVTAVDILSADSLSVRLLLANAANSVVDYNMTLFKQAI